MERAIDLDAQGARGPRSAPATETTLDPSRGPETRRERAAHDLQGPWLAAILHTAVEGIILIDERGRVRSANPAAEQIFGWSQAELAGQNVRVLMPEPYRGEHDGYLANYLRTGTARIIGIGREVVGQRKDGSTFPMELSVSEVRVGDERLFTGFVRDISERKRLQEKFLRAQKSDVVARMAASIAHDFNNLLMGLRSCSTLALRDLEPGSSAALLVTEIEQSSQRGIALTRRLLAFTRPRSVELKPTQLSKLAAENALLLQQVMGEDVELAFSTGVLDDWVLADTGLLEQALINLAVNARDAMTTGGRFVVETSLAARADGGTDVCWIVSDNGCGMDEATLARAFEPFFTTKGPGLGTGLGLTSVLRIAEELRGSIAVESTPGQGTTFRMRFPQCPVPQACAPGSPSSTTPARTSGETILVVEDERLIRGALKRLLGGAGYRVLVAENSHEAIEVARAHAGPIDVLVTDIVLPGLGGRALRDEIARERPDLRALFMSAHPREMLVAQGRLEASAAFLEKPFDFDTLTTQLRELLGR
jgi:PAS domain S-box-containing protein